MSPSLPVYILSRGRPQAPTARALQADGVPFTLVVEPAEAAAYADVFGTTCLLLLPWDNPPGTRDGLVRARNFILDRVAGAAHWQLDDNIRTFWRRPGLVRERCGPAELLASMESLALTMPHVRLLAPAYEAFIHNGRRFPPYRLNRCTSSAILFTPDFPYRCRSLQEDLDLTLQVITGGAQTLLSYRYLITKPAAGATVGGLADAYAGEGKRVFAEDIARYWPDLVYVRQRPNGAYGPRIRWSRVGQGQLWPRMSEET